MQIALGWAVVAFVVGAIVGAIVGGWIENWRTLGVVEHAEALTDGWRDACRSAHRELAESRGLAARQEHLLRLRGLREVLHDRAPEPTRRELDAPGDNWPGYADTIAAEQAEENSEV